MTEEIKNNRIKCQEKIARDEYDVFLSYSHKDLEQVEEISKQLQDNGIAPWVYPWANLPGLPWEPELEKRIKSIGAAAICIGNGGIASDSWHEKEMDAFVNESARRGCRIIPVLLPDASSNPILPPALAEWSWIDFSKKNPDPLELLIQGITGKKPGKIYRPGILIASLGDSPVIVSSMYDLLVKQEMLTIDRVAVLVPNDGEAQSAYKLVQEALPDVKLQNRPLSFEDADSWLHACLFLHELYSLLDRYETQGDSVYLSLAGGRKSMAALMAWIVSFFPCVKKLYHVIDKKEEKFRSPSYIDGKSSTECWQLMHPDLDQLLLVEIPFERGVQINEKFYEQLSGFSSRNYEEAEALITGQIILQNENITPVDVTKDVREQFRAICQRDGKDIQVLQDSLLQMSKITTLHDPGIGTDVYPYDKNPKISKKRAKKFRYFIGLEAPIRPVFYTDPVESDDQIKRIVICSLEEGKENGYRPLKEVAQSLNSLEDQFSVNVLRMPSPVESVLIVPLGKSPMVATQLYTLLTEQEKHTIHEVVLIYPQRATEIFSGAEFIQEALYKECHVHCQLVGIPELEDITDKAACRKYQDFLENEINRVRREYPTCKIDLALSGGRKGMTAMTIFAAQKKHISYVYHTLIADELPGSDEKTSKQIEEETTLENLKDNRSQAYDRLFLRAYMTAEPYPYARFSLFRVPIFPAHGW